ncbi:hemerythrin domain-containing protein [Yinghuangia sp. YIM S10712]|uniref:hemerythrin domain-containing protein n=1 Tax=Yinghuangia sp. YIM S10712 TaxID=3436930 RepID=UPI003F5396D9
MNRQPHSPGGQASAPVRAPDHRHTASDPRIDLLLIHAVHEALRRDLRRAVAWSRTCFPVTPPAWTDFHRYLVTYLDAESAVLMPVLHGGSVPAPGHAGVAAELERKRRRVILLADTVDDCLSGRGPASRTAEYVNCLNTALTEYLDHEQSVFLPLLAASLTTSEWAHFDAALRQPFGLATGVALCSWLVDDLSQDRRDAVRRLFPPAVRLAHRWFGARRTHRKRWDVRGAASVPRDGRVVGCDVTLRRVRRAAFVRRAWRRCRQ